MRKVKRRVKMSKFEKLLYTLALTLILIAPISIVFSKATLAKINFDVEKEKKAFAEENDMNPDAIEETEELLNILGQGHHENQSFFAL